ncbi:MAG: alanine racemase [Cyanobacteria bacterium P01_F01_bin.143]
MVSLLQYSENLSSTKNIPNPTATSPLNRQRAWVEIDSNALAYNVKQLRSILSPQTALMAVVKADGYGHGAVEVAQTAIENGATWLAVATLDEGIKLRQEGITSPILLLGAINSPEEINEIAQWQLQATICNRQQASMFSETLQTSLLVHLNLDTGMSRLGTNWQDALEFVSLVDKLPNLEIAGIYSHFATADDRDPTIMNLQHQRFQNAIAKIKAQGINPNLLHMANSAATLQDPELHHDLVRVGLAIYGLYPASHLQEKLDLKPVLQVKARVTQVKKITKGTGVSYGHKYRCDRDMAIAVVGIGYADGVARSLSNRLQAIIRGELVQQIGAITMDQMILDVSHLDNLQPGEIVTLIGQDGEHSITADDWANSLDTISWEILCGFKHRLHRIHHNDD